ncbi:hypothetical protein BpHYR1_019255 [Brachionus plicatilis]|uniref:Uncharacterized protein n=1 Tax=Brachionus plicatilis TaxID=10195 RepID=A0A3M7PEC8_BRAPC|nr:hypothetical protein BpHYR1_019255 [Brachionus plicatilis]
MNAHLNISHKKKAIFKIFFDSIYFKSNGLFEICYINSKISSNKFCCIKYPMPFKLLHTLERLFLGQYKYPILLFDIILIYKLYLIYINFRSLRFYLMRKNLFDRILVYPCR